ncbi:MAG: hypothetical protein SGILL_001292 [Bacillariaceae sp.]
MKTSVYAAFAVALAAAGVSAGGETVAKHNVAKEDGTFWDRYLQDVSSFTPSPTPGCDLIVNFNCTDCETGDACEAIPPEEDLICSCPECVRELVFTYTGAGCNGNEAECEDFVPAPHSECARVTMCDADDELNCPFDGEVCIGDTITLSDSDCLPANMAATVASEPGLLLQTTALVTGCTFPDRGLVLKEEYGSFTSEGYSCDENDVHNCLIKIQYGLEACNVGGRDEQVYEFQIDMDGEICDLTEDIPASDLELAPEECLDAIKTEFIDVCTTNEYCAKAVVNMTNPETGPPCEKEDEIKFNTTVSTIPPTPSPTPGTPEPTTPEPTTPEPTTPEPTTPEPTTPEPSSPAPTSSCIIDVAIEGCFNFTPPFDNNCQGRPVIVEFRYNGGDCSQSDNLQDRQKFDCFDIEADMGGVGPPPTDAGSSAYVVATTLGGADVYFEGFVPIGETFTLNEGLIFDRLSADMNVTFYDPAGSDDPASIVQVSNMMQTEFLHLSCSQPLFLLDRFGAAQVVRWVEDDGREVTTEVNTTVETLSLSLDTTGIEGQEGVVLREMNILSNTEGFINKTDEVNGVVLMEGDTLDLCPINVTLDLSTRTRYTFFTTISGETLDGSAECNGFDFHECIVGAALPPAFPTLAPTPSPTTTPFPTPDPEETECSAEAVINCVVTEPFNDAGCGAIPPLTPRCSTGANLALLTFDLTTNKCDGTEGCVDVSDQPIPDQVYVEITDCETTAFFQGTANVGDELVVNSRGNFLCDTFEVSIQTVNFNEEEEANEGIPLQNLTLPTTCMGPAEDEDGWTINENYGALTLIQYTSDIDGVQAEFVTVLMSYVVENPGPFGANINSASLDSAFSGESEILEGVLLVDPRSQQQLSTETEVIDMLASAGSTFSFALSIGGSSANEAANACASDTTFSFSI